MPLIVRAPNTLDPFTLARWQSARDREITRKTPGLLEHKRERMLRSPLAFLRGSADLFHRIMALRPDLMVGPGGAGWIIGDLHVENFGAFRAERPTRPGRGDDEVVFDLNDLDLAALGPWHFDIARLTTSLLLAARDRGVPGDRAVALARALLSSWRDVVFGEAPVAVAPTAIAKLVATVGARTRAEMLGSRTVLSRGARRFVRGPRYTDVSTSRALKCTRAFEHYREGLPKALRPGEAESVVEDVAFRIAGTGSLGMLRVAVLTRGHGPPDGHWIFDLKETADPPTNPALRVPDGAPAERVVQAYRACLDRVPRMLGTARIGRRSMLVRRLSPQEDKLAIGSIHDDDLEAVVRHLGALTGRAHRHGATERPKRPWRDADLDAMVERAISLAGIHYSVWLAWCSLA